MTRLEQAIKYLGEQRFTVKRLTPLMSALIHPVYDEFIVPHSELVAYAEQLGMPPEDTETPSMFGGEA